MSEGTSEASLSFERVIFFSDAVFAIVITLLVLPLAAEFEVPDEPADLFGVLREERPYIVCFLISFLVVGQFWMAHHRMYRMIDGYDGGLLWLNLIFLLTVTFMPFPTSVLGKFPAGENNLPVVFYAASLTLTSACVVAMWLYARARDLLRPTVEPVQVRAYTAGSLATLGLFVVGIGAAFLGLWAAGICWP
jgi:uncharacterized membrane protein